MNSKLLFTYALAKTLHQEDKDYIETFLPFVLKVLPRNLSLLEVVSIQEKIEKDCGLCIPEHTLQTIITRAKRNDYAISEFGKTKLTNKGIEFLDSLESENNVSRRINDLLGDLRSYLNEPSLSLEGVYNIILEFINENIEPIIEFFNPSGECKLDASRIKIHRYKERIIEYLKLSEKQKPEYWQTLNDIVYGSVISTSVATSDIAMIDKKFKDLQIFLDSNFIFSLLDFDFPEITKPAKELFELLKKYKFGIKVFDFTINEMVRVLSNYAYEQHKYIVGVKVNSIYSILKSRNMTEQDIREFIQNIEEKIWELGIEIELSNLDFVTYRPNKEYLDIIQKYKPLHDFQNERVYYHDLAVIEKIKEIRKTRLREIETSKAIFLTSDLKLSKFNFFGMSHKEDSTICEVIPDRLLTNILWLKNPTIVKDLPLTTIISIHSHEILINKRVWDRFYENIRKLKEEGRIEDKDISMLFYNKYIVEVLLELDENSIGKLSPQFILVELDKVQKIIDLEKKDTEKTLESLKVSFGKKIAEETEKTKQWQTKLTTIKEKIKLNSGKKADSYTRCIFYIFFGLILSTIIAIPRALFMFIAAVLTALAFFGITFNIWNLKSKLESKLFNQIYKRELKNLCIEEQEKGDV